MNGRIAQIDHLHGGDTITASAGDFAFLLSGIAHSFKNTGDGYAKALVLIAGAEGVVSIVGIDEVNVDRNHISWHHLWARIN